MDMQELAIETCNNQHGLLNNGPAVDWLSISKEQRGLAKVGQGLTRTYNGPASMSGGHANVESLLICTRICNASSELLAFARVCNRYRLQPKHMCTTGAVLQTQVRVLKKPIR